MIPAIHPAFAIIPEGRVPTLAGDSLTQFI
jgi:hypothetical protein